MKKNKWIFIIVIVITIAVFGYNYLYKSHRDISSEEASFSIKVEALTNDFKSDENTANAKYLDKTIDVSGNVTAIDIPSSTIIIDNVLSATFKDEIDAKIKENQLITIKGRFIGYDELLEEFKMDQVTLIK
ncbi:hypothetical protein FIA58_005565 [Flavobacterium jejuense]|uniref:tRNA_anti-like protein n=1 Tax=Flavobacterium jejuense TaxID=1544455 RepID=A0ABX0INI0_9FLAO|nr:hypothetical protein [Flavobacterium jejuense]NHN25143.1 hypothetical protein [Flavobacterium jejuense]